MQEKFKTLQPKQIFKNYREMCEYLNEPFLEDNSKQSQFKEWRRFIKFKIRKNKSIEIVEVYNSPIEKVDKRTSGNNIIYSNLVQLILLDYLAKNVNQNNYLNLSKTKLYEILGMCNEVYIIEFIHKYKQDTIHKEKIRKFKEDNNLSDYDLDSFYQRSSAKFNSVLDKALISLEKKAIITIQNNHIVREFEPTSDNNRIREKILALNKEESLSKAKLDRMCRSFQQTQMRFATQDELPMITEIKREAMNKVNIDEFTWEVVINKQKMDSFYREFNLILLERTNFCLCYQTKTFFFTESTVESGINILERQIEDIKAQRRKLNGLIKDAVDKKAIDIYHNTNDDLLEKLLENENVFSFKDNYITAQMILSEFFIQLNETEKEN